MSLIYWIFVVDLNKLACVVVNFLIKSHCHLVGVNLFYVSSLPPLPALHIKLVLSSTRRQVLPIGEFAFVLFTRTHLIL